MQRVFAKLDVHTRAQAVAVAYGAELIEGGAAALDEVEAHFGSSSPAATAPG